MEKQEITWNEILDRINKYTILAGLAWTFILLCSLTWNIWRQDKHVKEIAKSEARTHFSKDLAFRYWATSHGGVYVPVTARTPSNPYLALIPDRDIKKPSGELMTLMNPAYMMRQMNEDFAQLYGISVHITSLKPLRPENKPDPWEAAALKEFEHKKNEVFEFTAINHKPCLRLIRPMMVTEGCLKCHAHQGYKIGDIRGGISITLPMSLLREMSRSHHAGVIGGHLLLWLTGAAALLMGRKRISRTTQRQMEAEAEKRRLRHLLSNIINSMPSIVVGVNPEGRVLEWNREAEKESGISADIARGRLVEDIYPFLSEEMSRVKIALHEGVPNRALRVPKQVNGETRYCNITVYPLITNSVTGAVIRIDDITDRVRIDEMMIQTEKMLSVGGLAAGMAHEINNPLAGIMQNVQVIRNRLSPNISKNLQAAADCHITMEALQDYIEKRGIPEMINAIMESGHRAARIVSNMLNFSRKSETLLQPHRLEQLLDKTIEITSNDYNLKKNYDFRHFNIIRQYAPNTPPVWCESVQIQQVFLNILKNGAQAMRDNSGQCPDPTFILRIFPDKDQKFVSVEIEDNGPGLPQELIKRAFEPFFTTKPVGMGVGLGLSVSYFIITETHKGALSVESPPGKGAKFIIRLPVKGE